MAHKKAPSKPVKKPAHDEKPHEEKLYVSLDMVEERRKNLLLSLRESLLVQQEYEDLIELRTHKAKIATQIKTEMNQINAKYMKVKSHFPQVKDAIAQVEMELVKIRGNIDTLNKQGVEVAPTTTPVPTVTKKEIAATVVEKKPVSRLGRIENNLKIIEDKLKGI